VVIAGTRRGQGQVGRRVHVAQRAQPRVGLGRERGGQRAHDDVVEQAAQRAAARAQARLDARQQAPRVERREGLQAVVRRERDGVHAGRGLGAQALDQGGRDEGQVAGQREAPGVARRAQAGAQSGERALPAGQVRHRTPRALRVRRDRQHAATGQQQHVVARGAGGVQAAGQQAAAGARQRLYAASTSASPGSAPAAP
jgi:hypothetical protein